MSKQKELSKPIQKIYLKNFETISMYFWVEGQRNILPGISIEKSIEKYLKFVSLDLDIETALTTYHRIKKEFLNG